MCAALNDVISAGLSKCSQRTDDAVSGSRTQMSPLAAFLLTLAVAPATTSAAAAATTAMSRTVDLRKTFFTWFLLTGGQLRSPSVQTRTALRAAHLSDVKLSEMLPRVKSRLRSP